MTADRTMARRKVSLQNLPLIMIFIIRCGLPVTLAAQNATAGRHSVATNKQRVGLLSNAHKESQETAGRSFSGARLWGGWRAAARRIGKSDRVICIPLLVSWPRPLVTIPYPPSNRTHSHLARPFLFGFRNSDFFRPSHFGLRISSRPCHRIAAVGVEGPQHVESSKAPDI